MLRNFKYYHIGILMFDLLYFLQYQLHSLSITILELITKNQKRTNKIIFINLFRKNKNFSFIFLKKVVLYMLNDF